MRGLDKGIICVVALTLLVVVMPVGCSDEQKKNAATIKRGLAEPIRIEISDANTHKNINLETIFDSVTFVPLSNAPKAAVSGINQAIVIDSTILILDRYGSKSVKAFSLAGEFLADIGHRGRGPGEYIEPTMMEVNPCKEVVIWDQFRQQLLHYDLGGKYIKSREYPFFSMKFHEFDDNNLMFVSLNSDNKSFVKDYSLFVSDSLGVVSKYGLYRKKNTYETILNDHDFLRRMEMCFIIRFIVIRFFELMVISLLNRIVGWILERKQFQKGFETFGIVRRFGRSSPVTDTFL